jgi:tol-pal system protein YbgF
MKNYPAVLIAVLSTILFSNSAMSAAGVIEATPSAGQGQGSSGALTSSAAGQAASNDALVMLLDQFTAMRSELEILRGMVEEQAYEISRLQRDSMDRYTDLDARISALYEDDISPTSGNNIPPARTPPQAPSTTDPSAGSTPQASTAPMVQPVAAAVTGAVSQSATPALVQPGLMTEQQLYQLALDSLLQSELFQKSINEFDQYLATYPDGRFVTNAYYWKGQAYVNLSMYNEARDSFEVIVSQYPDGRKVDDAMYSLGSVYDRLGNPGRARELLQEVKARYPNTSAANLADIYLRSMN